MTTEQILEVTLREMTAYGEAWRMDWSGFDGRTLLNQLNRIETWARKALAAQADPHATVEEYRGGTEFVENV